MGAERSDDLGIGPAALLGQPDLLRRTLEPAIAPAGRPDVRYDPVQHSCKPAACQQYPDVPHALQQSEAGSDQKPRPVGAEEIFVRRAKVSTDSIRDV